MTRILRPNSDPQLRTHRAALSHILRLLNRPAIDCASHRDAPDLLSQCLLELTDLGLVPWSTMARRAAQEAAS